MRNTRIADTRTTGLLKNELFVEDERAGIQVRLYLRETIKLK